MSIADHDIRIEVVNSAADIKGARYRAVDVEFDGPIVSVHTAAQDSVHCIESFCVMIPQSTGPDPHGIAQRPESYAAGKSILIVGYATIALDDHIVVARYTVAKLQGLDRRARW